MLAGALLFGTAVGLVGGIAATRLISAPIRPDVVIAVVVGVPSVIGLVTIMLSGRRWVTALGALILAIAPGWFGALVAIQVVHGV